MSRYIIFGAERIAFPFAHLQLQLVKPAKVPLILKRCFDLTRDPKPESITASNLNKSGPLRT
jgi:glyoxylate carboligase